MFYSITSSQLELWEGKIIEVTGISAIGKSSTIEDINCSTTVNIFDAGCLIGAPKNKKIIFLTQFIHFFFFLFNKKIPTFGNIYWLLSNSMRLNEPFLMKLNVFRNCLLKFLYQKQVNDLLKLNKKKVFLIDKGISHIPFLLQNQKNINEIREEFNQKFKEHLSLINVLYLEGDIDTFTRLKNRGHKRLKNSSDDEIKKFIKMNFSTIENIKKNSFYFKSFFILKACD